MKFEVIECSDKVATGIGTEVGKFGVSHGEEAFEQFNSITFYLYNSNTSSKFSGKDQPVAILSSTEIFDTIKQIEGVFDGQKTLEKFNDDAARYLNQLTSEIKTIQSKVAKEKLDKGIIHRSKIISKAVNQVVRICNEVTTVSVKYYYITTKDAVKYIQDCINTYES